MPTASHNLLFTCCLVLFMTPCTIQQNNFDFRLDLACFVRHEYRNRHTQWTSHDGCHVSTTLLRRAPTRRPLALSHVSRNAPSGRGLVPSPRRRCGPHFNQNGTRHVCRDAQYELVGRTKTTFIDWVGTPQKTDRAVFG